MDQDEEQELAEEEAAEASDNTASSQPTQTSPSEEERALAEQEEQDIETAESPEEALRKINALQKKLRAEGPWAAEVKDKNFGKSTYQPPESPSRGAIHDRGNPGETTSS